VSGAQPPGASRSPGAGGSAAGDGDRRRFLEHTLRERDDAGGRALLDAEWRYLGPLLGARGPEPLEVLDLACGSGHQSLAWAERGFRVTGLDFDPGLLVAGRERVRRAPGGLEVRWACGDATRLPFRDRAFDVVFNNSLLEHVPDWRAVLAETARVLRPGGLFVLYTTNRWCPVQQEVNGFPFYPWLPGPLQRRVLAWIMEHRRDLVNYTDFPAIHWFTFAGMRRAFRSAGLEPFDRLDLLARFRPHGWRGWLARALALGGPLKWPYQLYAISMALYGIRRPGPAPAGLPGGSTATAGH
jgi:2-polyprenyl-6-hydroxyphenyl methylase/3-demethylubiquinone-9 3-methyltransferase